MRWSWSGQRLVEYPVDLTLWVLDIPAGTYQSFKHRQKNPGVRAQQDGSPA